MRCDAMHRERCGREKMSKVQRIPDRKEKKEEKRTRAEEEMRSR